MQEATRESTSKSGAGNSPAAVDYSPSNERPLVSAIMPTYGRPELVNESVAMFLAQDYENKELIILNDCVGQTFELDHPFVTVLNHPHRFANLGEKRNYCIEQASGEIIAIWDDDDVYLPWRLSVSVEAMLRDRLSFYRPAEFWAYWGDESLHDNRSTPGWVNHPFCCFTKKLWNAVGGYPQQSLGEDSVLFKRFHELLGESFIKTALPKFERPGILRGASPYKHLSIDGGRDDLHTDPGRFAITPSEIQDAPLKNAWSRLVADHVSAKLRTASSRTNQNDQDAKPVLSVCVSLKNRSLVSGKGRPRKIFPGCVASLASAAEELQAVFREEGSTRSGDSTKVELVVADFQSDDLPLADWIDDCSGSLLLKVITVDGPFSRGRGLNVAIEHATSDSVFLLDADMLVPTALLHEGIMQCAEQAAYFPIFRYLDEDGEPAHLEIHSYGNAFAPKRLLDAVGGVPEFTSWGGEDDLLHAAIKKIANVWREEAKGFLHQWHPEDCRHSNYAKPPRSDQLSQVSEMTSGASDQVFWATHPDWEGELTLTKSGRMIRDNGDGGEYRWSCQHELTLVWDRWAPEVLRYDTQQQHWVTAGKRFVLRPIWQTWFSSV